jgi:transmembrane sensor
MNASSDAAHLAAEQHQREAQAWVRRLHSGAATQQDAQAFRRWLATSVSHEQAFTEAQQWWRALDPAMTQLVSRNRALAVSLQTSRAPRWWRRAFLGGAVSAVAVGGVALTYGSLYGPFNLESTVEQWRADYRTGTGEQRRIALTKRVSVDLNTLTAINRRNIDGYTVGIELISGEAAVDLQAPVRAFSVTAGAGRTVSDTGCFEVRHMDGTTCVTCVQGTLRVEHPLGMRVLSTRERMTYERHSLGETVAVDSAALSAWRDGILVFRQTPLAQVIDEINRYRPGRVVLMAKGVGSREVSGRFPIHSLNTVLLQIQHTYDLDARALPGGLLLLG